MRNSGLMVFLALIGMCLLLLTVGKSMQAEPAAQPPGPAIEEVQLRDFRRLQNTVDDLNREVSSLKSQVRSLESKVRYLDSKIS